MALAPPSDTTSAVLYVTYRSLVARDAVILLCPVLRHVSSEVFMVLQRVMVGHLFFNL